MKVRNEDEDHYELMRRNSVKSGNLSMSNPKYEEMKNMTSENSMKNYCNF